MGQTPKHKQAVEKKSESPLHNLKKKNQADIFVISGDITRQLADKLIDEIYAIKEKSDNALLFLCTYGGDGDAAFIIAKTFQRYYTNLILYLSGFCKSAGTLIALGANQIVISPKGELGPLDIQLNRDDELAKRTSGLDTSSAISTIGDEAFSLFEDFFIKLIAHSGANITTKTAAEIATQLTSSLITPITSQLDPLKICETARSIRIAYDYSIRLGAKPKIVRSLIYDYPTHSFVIGFDEAKDLFENVSLYADEDENSSIQIGKVLKDLGHSDCVRIPSPTGLAIHIKLDSVE
jgi:hypothetical protein